MIPNAIQSYLRRHRVPFERYAHPRAVSAMELVDALNVPVRRVAKSVIVLADRQPWIVVVPAMTTVDLRQIRHTLGVRTARLAAESEFVDHFPDCETGAEPPFGELYGLPVAMDESLSVNERLLFRAGSHEEALEMRFQDFARLEWPLVASFIQPLPREKEEGKATYGAPMEDSGASA
ncbi:aminoacyl-tRNA deacylase [Corallococcus aberystwythensis]|nr:YbaK/EbsC family protein [Corallococcus aberystwythensis]